jgi:hypothetical protein
MPKLEMPEHSFSQKLLLALVVIIGVFPVLYFLSVEIGIAEGIAQTADTARTGDPTFDRFVENIAFGVGEKLDFDINYGFINAGTASMEVARVIDYEDRPCYQVITRANSNSFFSTWYRVDDRVESIVDALGLFSWRFEKHLREGNYSADKVYTFNQKRNFAVYEDDTLPVVPQIQDALSTLYYVRTMPLTVGKSVFVDTFVDGKSMRLEVRVIKKETVSVEAGTFDCIVVEPITQSVGVFKHEGRLTVWLTDDYVRMPVLMKSKILVGSISAELTDFQLGEIWDF